MSYNAANGLVNKKVLETYVASLIQSESRFIARRAIPVVDSQGIRAGNLIVHDVDDAGPEDLVRAQGEPFYPRAQGQEVLEVPFSCADLGATVDVDEIDRRDAAANSSKLLKLEQGAMKQAALRLLRREEAALGAILGNAGNWTNLIGGTDFPEFDSSDGDPLAAFLQAQSLGGRFSANSIIFGSRAMFLATVSAPQYQDTLPLGADRSADPFPMLAQRLASRLGFEKAFVMEATGRSTRNPANKARADLGGDWIWVGYLPGDVSSYGSGGRIRTEATAMAQVVAGDEELLYDRIGQLHKFSVARQADFVRVSADLGVVMTNILE